MVRPEEPPIIADRYRLDHLLGAGAFGEVRAGWDLRLDRPVAVKLLRAGRVESDDAIRRFRREARVTARLRSPHAVPTYDVGQLDDGRLFMVMERVDGRTLGEVLRAEGPLSTGRALDILDQLCALLAEAHGAGLVHRDLKPSNIMLDVVAGHGERVRVLDFGMAKVVDGGDSTRSVVGTAAYIAPEIWREEPVDGRADLYAAGLLLYEMLAGAPAVTARTVHGAARAHLFEGVTPLAQRDPPVEVPAPVEALIAALVDAQRAARPADAGAVRAWIARIEGRPAPTRPVAHVALDETLDPVAPGAAPPGTFDAVGETLDGADSLDAAEPSVSAERLDTPAGPVEPLGEGTPPPGPRRARGRLTWALLTAAVIAALVAWAQRPAESERAPAGALIVDAAVDSEADALGEMDAAVAMSDDGATDGMDAIDAIDVGDGIDGIGASDGIWASDGIDAGGGAIPPPDPRPPPRRRRAAPPRPASVRIASTPTGARVWIGERLVGRTPVEVPVSRATTLVVEAPAHYARRVTVEPGAAPVNVALEPVVRLE